MVLGRNETILLGVCLVCGGGRCYKHNIYYFCLHVGGLVRGSGYGGGGVSNGNLLYVFLRH